MGMATLGRPGDTVTFRIDPDEVKWNWKINTTVQDTVGGRVVQVVGASLSDITVSGSYGEDHSKKGSSASDMGPGRSWVLAEQFIRRVRQWMEYQSRHPNYYSKTPPNQQSSNPTLRFTYPVYGWDFEVYIKDINDMGGNTVAHKPNKFSYHYTLTMFVVQENAAALGILRGQAARAADSFIQRIAEGIGWERYHAKTGMFEEHLYSGYDPRFDQKRAINDFQSIYSGGASSPGASNPDPTGGDANAGGPFSATDLARIAYDVGFRNSPGSYRGEGLTWAVAVALAESGGRADAVNINSDGSRDRGLWQINDSAHPDIPDGQAFSPKGCAQAAWSISSHGNSFEPWNTMWASGYIGRGQPGTPDSPAGKRFADAAAGVQAFLNGNSGSHPATKGAA